MRSTWRTSGALAELDRGTLRDIALVCLADAIVGASFGAISVSGGLRPWLPVTMSVLVFAGGAQFAAVGVILAGGSPAAAVAAGLVLNGRLLPYGFAVADVLDGRWWTRLAGAHVMTDESVAFALRRRGAERRAAFWACGIALFAAWNVAVVLGALAGAAIGSTTAFGLDAAFPAVALALVLPSLADRGTRRAAVLGAVLAVAAAPVLPAGLPVLIALAGLVLAAPPAGPADPADPEPADSASREPAGQPAVARPAPETS
jgi:4-azaleucine resistance transporter AzlC